MRRLLTSVTCYDSENAEMQDKPHIELHIDKP